MSLDFKLGYVRKSTPIDAILLAKWWSDGRVMAHAGFPNGLKTDINALKKRLEEEDPLFVLWIIENESHQAIGEMSYRIKDSTATIGIKICELSEQGKGMGPKALKAFINYLFEVQKVHKIILDTMIENTRAQKVYRSLKFTQTAINPNIWQDQLGTWRTSVDFVLTKETYEENKAFYHE